MINEKPVTITTGRCHRKKVSHLSNLEVILCLCTPPKEGKYQTTATTEIKFNIAVSSLELLWQGALNQPAAL